MKNIDIIRNATEKAITDGTITAGQKLDTYNNWIRAGRQVTRGEKAITYVNLWTKKNGKFILKKTALFAETQTTLTRQEQATTCDGQKADRILRNNAADILDKINTGDISQAKTDLQDIIYQAGLTTANATSRYQAMKRYYKGIKNTDARLTAPFKDYRNRYGETINVFIDGHCVVATTEDLGTIKTFDGPQNAFFRADNFLEAPNGAVKYRLNLTDGIARAKANGFRPTKKTDGSNRYLYRINDCYIDVHLLKKAFDIIDDGDDSVTVYYSGRNEPVHIVTTVGHAAVLPVKYDRPLPDNHIIEAAAA